MISKGDDFFEAQDRLATDIGVERIRQNLKFTGTEYGVQAHNIFVWLSILGEEVGESHQAVLDTLFKKTDLGHVREELIQVAAVAVAIIERLDARDISLWAEEPTMKDKHDKV